MRNWPRALTILCLIAQLWGLAVAQQPASAIALTGGTLIDGTGAPRVENAVVIMENGRIKAIGTAKNVSIPAGAKRIDVSGKYVLPGLLDGHVHLRTIGARGKHNEAFGQELVDRIAQNANAHLLSGVTTVFDVGGPIHELKQARDEINAGKRVGARVFMGGPSISADRGEPPRAPRSAEEALSLKRAIRGVFIGVTGARSKVRELASLGADHIKVYQTGGHDHGYAGYAVRVPPEEMVAIVEEARKAGIAVTAHTRGLEGFRNGIRAGLNSMQHVVYCGIRIPDEYIKLLADSPVYIIPTIVALSAPLEYIKHPEMLEEARQELNLPKEAIEDLFKLVTDPKEYVNDPGFYFYRMGYAEVKLGQENLKRLAEAKARIAMGTDAGTSLNFHGTSYREVAAMVEAGLSPMDAIVASTRNVALAFNKKDLGTLEVGKIADVIVIDGDPLANVSNLKNVVHVFKDGKQFK
jgi:imidazolonepropionase-like amidohydrolase